MPHHVIERTVPGPLVAILALSMAAPTALASPRGRRSAATITGSFADSCRDFSAHSSKDISHVVIRYVDGRVVKDECIRSHEYEIDGGAGDEIDLAIVKSGTTREEFDCVPSSRAPVALLEVKTPPNDQTVETCYDFFSGGLACEQSSPRNAWISTRMIPDNGGSESGFFHWGCGGLSEPSLCPFTVSFRGVGSSDPDHDITSWSIDFGDGTSASGSWGTAPPAEVTHEYTRDSSGSLNCGGVLTFGSNVCLITLTVTDSAGQSDSDVMVMAFVDQTPD
jgi:hypothetical protein